MIREIKQKLQQSNRYRRYLTTKHSKAVITQNYIAKTQLNSQTRDLFTF